MGALAAVSNGSSLANVAPELRGDPEIARTAVHKRGIELKYVAPELHGDRDLVMAALIHSERQSGKSRGIRSTIKYVDSRLQGEICALRRPVVRNSGRARVLGS